MAAGSFVPRGRAVMIFNPLNLTGFHTDLSLIAIVAGIVVAVGLVTSKALGRWTALYLTAAVLTSLTGFLFKSASFGPSHWLGVFSLIVLAPAILGRYFYHLAGSWRWIYVLGAVTALFFLVFVAVAQAFMKIPALHPLAPTGSEPPFAIAQLVNLVIFVIVGVFALRRFRYQRA
jgi:hypothetical protein